MSRRKNAICLKKVKAYSTLKMVADELIDLIDREGNGLADAAAEAASACFPIGLKPTMAERTRTSRNPSKYIRSRPVGALASFSSSLAWYPAKDPSPTILAVAAFDIVAEGWLEY